MVFFDAANSYEENHVDRILNAVAYAKTFEEIRESWIALGELSDVTDTIYRVQSYIILLDYYIGSGNHTYLDELILRERKNILMKLKVKYEQPIECQKKYASICKTKEIRNSDIMELITQLENM